ncbi:MAG: EAL domain-containing protein [Chloroflexi bacterium]|nr:EAL domain-containing protein [Chloroflexota bacterium]
MESKLAHRDTFSAFEGTIEDRYIIESYVPLRMGATDPIEGVFEVYTDVTSSLEAIKSAQRNMALGVPLIFGLLYAILFIIVKHADSIIQSHHSELESRVEERTFDLKEANLQLQAEMIERQKIADQLVHNANYDPLTNLPNRTLFIERLGRAVERAKRRSDYMFAVLFVDLDGLKMINDSLGHSSGDQVLTEFAERLKKNLRPPDTIARFGGDEFTILIEDIEDVSEVLRVAERIQEILSLPFTLKGKELFSSVSIGIAMSATGYNQPEDILRDADIAMYRAKSKGGAQHQVFDKDMHIKAVNRLQLETDLRQAIEQEQFRVYYQPIVLLATGEITAFEALVRWEHPERGLLLPIEFIQVAEETGMIIDIDWLVMREACRQMSALQKKSPSSRNLSITVNISVIHLARKGLIERIEKIIEETGLNPFSLGLEITESALLEDDVTTINYLTKLNARGFQLQLDDFGKGYSSLSYLHRFPIDAIKIDRSFISRIGVDGESTDIAHTIVKLAHNMGMRVIAEGIETKDQLEKLLEYGCKYGQGFLFSKPVASLEMAALLVEGVKV